MPIRKVNEISDHVLEILKLLGHDVLSGALAGTPLRVAKFLCEAHNESKVNWALFDEKLDPHSAGQMVVVGPVAFSSLCEHHLLPFFGHAWIGYIPSTVVSEDGQTKHRFVGLSKLARAVHCFSTKLQIQERITEAIATGLRDAEDSMGNKLAPTGVGVVVEAEHTCMCVRGVKSVGAKTSTQAFRGVFLNSEVRAEFLNRVTRLVP